MCSGVVDAKCRTFSACNESNWRKWKSFVFPQLLHWSRMQVVFWLSSQKFSLFFSQLEKLSQLLSVLFIISLSTCNKPTDGKRRDVNELHIKHKTTSSSFVLSGFLDNYSLLVAANSNCWGTVEQGTKCTMHCCDTSTYINACVSVLLVHLRLFQACKCGKIKSDHLRFIC